MAEVFLATALVAFGLMLVTWLISLWLKDVSIVDIVWGLGFTFISWALYLRFGPDDTWRTAIVLMVSIWGIRLASYIGRRKRGHGEDYRYQAMRKKNPEAFPLSQPVPSLRPAGSSDVDRVAPGPGDAPSRARFPSWLAYLGAALWLVGVFFEAVGDAQLARFKADPANKGKVFDQGLWRYTRHPNYFGDFCVWWGLYLIALDFGHWWTIVGPAVMSALLIRYSGAGLLEKTIGKRRPGVRRVRSSNQRLLSRLSEVVSAGLVWFRRDLRLFDNPAVAEAGREHDHVVGLFIVDPDLWDRGSSPPSGSTHRPSTGVVEVDRGPTRDPPRFGSNPAGRRNKRSRSGTGVSQFRRNSLGTGSGRSHRRSLSGFWGKLSPSARSPLSGLHPVLSGLAPATAGSGLGTGRGHLDSTPGSDQLPEETSPRIEGGEKAAQRRLAEWADR